MTNSLLKETVWHWRQGLKQMPIHSSEDHSDVLKVKELCTLVQTLEQAQNIISELKQNGIKSEIKKTHSSYGAVPKGSLIVYSEISNDVGTKDQKENIAKLKSYILENGGRVNEPSQKESIMKYLVKNLFGRK